MNYDERDYKVVQTGPASWGIQYANGPLEGGFSTFALAQEQAQVTAMTAAPPERIDTTPRNADEAQANVALAQDAFMDFLTNNPLASASQQAPFTKAISDATSQLNNFSAQNMLSRSNASPFAAAPQLDFQQQLRLADTMRTAALDEAVQLRLNQAGAAEIAQAENKAFAAESYFSNLSSSNPALRSGSGDSNLLSAFGAGGSNPLGGLFNGITNGLGSAATGILDQAKGLLGGLTNIGAPTGTGGPAAGPRGGTNTGLTGALDSALTGTKTPTTSGATGAADRRVRLSPKPSQRSAMFSGILQPLAATGGLVFPYTPQITYQGTVAYNPLKTVHANQDWEIYQNTESIQLTIVGDFTAQNKAEAEYLLASLHFLRTSTKMRFGESDSQRGLPPPQLFLDAYGQYMFNGLSVIVKAYDMQLPNNVDYIDVEAGGGVTQVPVHTTIQVQVVVQQTPKKSREFNWDKFASGDLMKNKGWL